MGKGWVFAVLVQGFVCLFLRNFDFSLLVKFQIFGLCRGSEYWRNRIHIHGMHEPNVLLVHCPGIQNSFYQLLSVTANLCKISSDCSVPCILPFYLKISAKEIFLR